LLKSSFCFLPELPFGFYRSAQLRVFRLEGLGRCGPRLGWHVWRVRVSGAVMSGEVRSWPEELRLVVVCLRPTASLVLASASGVAGWAWICSRLVPCIARGARFGIKQPALGLLSGRHGGVGSSLRLEVDSRYDSALECSVFHWFGEELPTSNSSNFFTNDGTCSWGSAQWFCSMSDSSNDT
jgi:hypothetical protein